MNKYRIIERYNEEEEIWFQPQQYIKWKFLWWSGEKWKNITGYSYGKLPNAEKQVRIHQKNNYGKITIVKEFN